MPAPPVSRRRALGLLGVAAAGVLPLGLAGCTPDTGTPDAVTPAEIEADRSLVADLAARIGELRTLVRRARAASAADRRRLAALDRLHRQQSSALGGTTAATSASAPTADIGEAAVLRAEATWIRSVTSAAVAAAEPRLAVLLGAMAAATGQALTVLADGRVEADPGPPAAGSLGGAAPDDDTVAALQAALAAEHAALYVIETLGARSAFDSDLRRRLGDLAARHRARREALVAVLTAAGVAPVGPASSYDLGDPDDLVRPVALAAAAGRAEEALLPRYAALVAATRDTVRRWALAAWRESAEEAVRWGVAPRRTPGLDGA